MAFAHPFFLFLVLVLPAQGASVYTHTLQLAYQETISLRIQDGRRLVLQELKLNPNNTVALLIANQQDFLTWAVQQNSSQYSLLLSRQEQRLQQLAQIKERSPWRDYALAEVGLQIALSKLLQGNKISAAWDLRQAYLQYSANARQYPNFLPNKKTLGALQVLIGSVPDSYRMLLSIIGMQGSIEQGMMNLQAAASKSNPFQEEALLLQALLKHLVDPDADVQATNTLFSLTRQSPDNLLYTFAAMHVLKKTRKSDAALQLYLGRPNQSGYLAFPYLHHMAADLYLYKGDFKKSVKANEIFMAQHQGEHYLKAAHFKLYLAHYLAGSPQQADKHLHAIKQIGRSDTEEDAYAARFAIENTHPNRYLLQSRLQSDGGYFEQALGTLGKMPLTQDTPQTERAEYFYRKARIYHGMLELVPAKRNYTQAITESRYTTLYFAPYSALQLGYIYQDEDKPELAKNWFNKALAYKGHEYKNSIDGKAKLALQTLNKN